MPSIVLPLTWCLGSWEVSGNPVSRVTDLIEPITEVLWVPSHSNNDDSLFLDKQGNPVAHPDTCNKSEKWLHKHLGTLKPFWEGTCLSFHVSTQEPLNPSNFPCKPGKLLSKNPFFFSFSYLYFGDQTQGLACFKHKHWPTYSPAPNLLVLSEFCPFSSFCSYGFVIVGVWWVYFETRSLYVSLAVL